jgi:hypothetical protein
MAYGRVSLGVLISLLLVVPSMTRAEGGAASKVELDDAPIGVSVREAPKTPVAEDVPKYEAQPDVSVDLDRLLILPGGFSYENQQRQGQNAEEWRARFLASRKAIEEAEEALAGYRTELDSMAGSGGQWQIAPPGANAANETGPMSVRLREDIRRGKEKLTAVERADRALHIEADLANVPAGWRSDS